MPSLADSPSLDDIVSTVVSGMDSPTPSFAALLDAVYRSRYSGPITVQFQQGCPMVLEFPRASIRLKLA